MYFVMCDCYRSKRPLYVQIWLRQCLDLACKRSIHCFSSCHRSLIKQMPFYRLSTLVAFFIYIVNQLVLAVDKSALKTEDNHDNAIEYTFINVAYSSCILGQSRISILIISWRLLLSAHWFIPIFLLLIPLTVII